MNNELSTNAFKKLNDFLIENDLLWLYFIVLGVFVIGNLIGWFLANRKTSKEIEKLKTEVENNQLEAQEKIISIFNSIEIYRKQYKKENQEFNQILTKFMKEKIPKYKQIELRKQLCSKFNYGIIPSFLAYFQLFRDIYSKNNFKKTEFTSLELIPFFTLCELFLSQINAEDILNSSKQNPFLISKTMFESIMEFAEQNTLNENQTLLVETKEKLYKQLI